MGYSKEFQQMLMGKKKKKDEDIGPVLTNNDFEGAGYSPEFKKALIGGGGMAAFMGENGVGGETLLDRMFGQRQEVQDAPIGMDRRTGMEFDSALSSTYDALVAKQNAGEDFAEELKAYQTAYDDYYGYFSEENLDRLLKEAQKQRDAKAKDPEWLKAAVALEQNLYSPDAFQYKEAVDKHQKELDEIKAWEQTLRQDKQSAKYIQYMTLAGKEDFAEYSAKATPMNDFVREMEGVEGAERKDAVSNLSEDELSVYNYLYNKEGRKKADEFYEFLKGYDLNRRQAVAKAKHIQDMGFLGETTMSVGTNFGAGVQDWAGGLKSLFTGDPAEQSASQIAAAILTEEAGPVASKVYGASRTVGNMAPSILLSKGLGTVSGALGASANVASKIGQTAGAVSMGTSAAGNAYSQKIAEGWEENEARTYGLLVGASEVATERIFNGIPGLGGAIDADDFVRTLNGSFSRLVAGGVINMAGEVAEEELQLLLEPAIEKMVVGGEYKAPTGKEALDTALVTMLSTGAMNAPRAIGLEINYNKYGKMVQEQHGWKELADRAQKLGADTTSAKIAEKISAEPYNVSYSDIGRLYTQMHQDGIFEKLTENEQKVVDAIFEKETKGKKLSKKEQEKLREEIVRDMDEGRIDTDDIESILGGDEYTAYQDALAKDNETIKEFAEMYTGDDLEIEARKFRENSVSRKLHGKLSETVSNMVKDDRLAESYRERMRMGQDFVADFDKFKGTKYADAAKKTLESAVKAGVNNSRAVHDLVDLAAQTSSDTGISYIFKSGEQIKADFIERQQKKIASLEGIENPNEVQTKELAKLKETVKKVQEGKMKVNGDITADGIVINLDGAKALNRVVGHEVSHALEKVEGGDALEKAAIAYAKSRKATDSTYANEYLERLAEVRRIYSGIDGYTGTDAEAKFRKEVVADLVGDYLFTDKDFVRNLSVNHRNVFQKIYDEIKYLCRIVTAGSKEARQLEKVKKTFEDAYRETEKGVSANGEVQHSVSEYAPTFYSNMERVAEGVKQEKLGAASVVSMLRGKGVKAEEIKWSGIETWLDGKKSVTKQELLEFMRGNRLQIEETELGSEHSKRKVKRISGDKLGLYEEGRLIEEFDKVTDEDGVVAWMPKNNKAPNGLAYSDKEDILSHFARTKFDSYTLEGGKNYREYLFTLPDSNYSNKAMRTHWVDYSGVLAHARVQDFSTADGNMLFVEEIQSDWHNEGHKAGYKDNGEKTQQEIRNESGDAYRAFVQSDVMRSVESRLWRSEYGGDATQLISDVFDGDKAAYSDLVWNVELASEERAFIDKAIAQEAARRAEIGNAPDEKSVPNAPFKDNYHEFVLKNLLRKAAENGYASIGWTTADTQSARWSDKYAEGYRIEYDQDIPKFLNKYGKQWGAKVGKTTLRNGTEVWTMPITDSMKQSVLYEGQPQYSVSDSDYMDAVNRGDMDTVQKMVDEAAKAAGYVPVARYHQTSAEFTEFDTSNPVAGANDSETPNGIFFKTNDHDIGLGGDKQMRMYLATGKTLSFADRKEASAWYCKHIDGYEALKNEFDRIYSEEYKPKFDAIDKEMFDENTTEERYAELEEAEERLIDDLKAVENDYHGRMRSLLDEYFLGGKSGYDSIELKYDGHRWVNGVREDVHTFIVFDGKQAKSADPVTYDDNGNVIPLSERFNSKNEDIRYSVSDSDGSEIGMERFLRDESDVSYSISYAPDIAKGQAAYLNNPSKTAYISSEELEEAHRVTQAMVDVMMKYSSILPEDKIGKVLTKNGSYDRSVENTTICVRTLAYNEFVDKVQEEIGRPLTQMESFLVSQKLYDIATEPQCLYCYVSLDRKAFNDMLLRYMQDRDTVIAKYNNSDKSPAAIEALYDEFLHGRKPTKEMRSRFDAWLGYVDSGTQLLSLADIATEARQSAINAEGGNLAEQLTDARKYAQSASWSKIQKDYVAYRDEILRLGDRVVKNLNEHYGMRWYSFSDYSAAFIVENMQQITDAAIRGLKGLSYTKDTDFAEIFAPSGMNINISVFVNQDADGNFFIDEKQSANFERAKQLRAMHPNVGIVATVTNDDALRWAASQEWSDVIIPFHIVRTGTDVAEYYKWLNYTAKSADTIKDADLWNAYVDSLNLKSEGAKKKVSKNIYPSEHKNDKATYLNLCESRGLSPRFVRFAGEDWYMKLVNETRLSADESSPLKPVYNEEAAKASFQKFVDKGGYEGGWYNEGVDVDAEAKVVAEDVLAGKQANEVDYGRQDGFVPEDLMARRKTNRTHGRMSISEEGSPEYAPVTGDDIFGKDVRLRTDDDFAPVRQDVGTVAENATVEDVAPVAPVKDAPVKNTNARVQELQAIVDNKDGYISQQAKDLYDELRELKKGVRASKRLGYLLDHGYEWRTLKTALLNIRDNPGQRVDQNSAIESIARKMLEEEYEGYVYELDKAKNANPNDNITTGDEKVNAKLEGLRTELENVRRMREEAAASYDEDIARLQSELRERQTSKAAKLQSLQTEKANNQQNRDDSIRAFDEEIARRQAQYDGKKNKNTKAANNLLRIIERLKRSKAEVMASYDNRVNDLGARITKGESDIQRSLERLQRLKGSIDAEYAKRISDLEKRIEKVDSKTYRTAEQRRTKMEEHTSFWQDLVGDTSTWRDLKLGLSYKTKTMRRFLREVVRDGNGNRDFAKADAIYDALETKYDHNEAMLKQESQKLKESFFKLKLTHAEDTYAQMLGELRSNPETQLTKEDVDAFYNKHKSKIDTEKVDKAINEARKLYDDLLIRVNEVLKEQGMKEIPYRKGYFPHFTNPKQGWLGKLLNWKTIDTEIPTSIAGLTEQFNPQRSWQSFNKERKSDDTDYSLYQGLDSYIHGALDWIYHIDDLQSRRALENYLRSIHSEEGVQAKIEAIKANEDYDYDEAQAQIELVLNEAANPLNNLVTELRNRTNTLANKKASRDRGMEEDTNRKFYSTMTNINNRVTANMVVGSLSSALTNFIPMVQSWHQVSPLYTVRGLGDYIRSVVRDDGMVQKSDYLTNRLMEEEALYQTGWDKVIDKAAIMMNVVDSITSQTVWRSKYLQNLHEGMSEAMAIRDADQFAKNLMAGRSRGNAPSLFDAKNPVNKIFTAFQLEVANQYGYMFKDVPQDSTSKAKLVRGYAAAFIGAYVYNALYSSLVGRDAAFDPISIFEDLFRDLGWIGDDDDKEEEAVDVALNLADNILEEVPYVGGLFGGGRVPIQSALPYSNNSTPFASMLNDVTDGNWGAFGKELLKPLYYLAMPVGGGQLKKTIEGVSMFSDKHPVSGSYTKSGSLRFPVEKTFGNVAQAALFGQYANKNAREYFDRDLAPLNPKQIEEYQDVDLPISEYWDYRQGLKGLDSLEEKADYIYDLDLPMRKQNLLINNIADRKEDIDLTGYGLYDSLEEFDYANKNPEKYSFLSENNISYAEWKFFDDDTKDAWNWAFDNPEKMSMAKAISGDVVDYRRLTSELYDIKADKDSSGKTISGSRKQKVLDYINSLDLDYGQKIILFRSLYSSQEDKDMYNGEIIRYLNSRGDISYAEEVEILKELGITVLADGSTYWE